MSKTPLPPDHPELLDTDADAHSSLRERVRQHLLKMAPLALIGATPLLSAQACDPAPVPACYQSDWSGKVSGHAAWGTDHGIRIVLLDLVSNESAIQIPTTFTVVGGSLLTSGKSDQLRIMPDAGAKSIGLHGILTCAFYEPKTIHIGVDLVPPDGASADAAPTVSIDSR
jgi:hypothetical protein